MGAYSSAQDLPGTVFIGDEEDSAVNLIPLKRILGAQTFDPRDQRLIGMQINNFQNGLLPRDAFITAMASYAPEEQRPELERNMRVSSSETVGGSQISHAHTTRNMASIRLQTMLSNPPRAISTDPGAPYEAIAHAFTDYVQAIRDEHGQHFSGGVRLLIANLDGVDRPQHGMKGFRQGMLREFGRPFGMNNGQSTSAIGYLAAHAQDSEVRREALAYATINLHGATLLRLLDYAVRFNHPDLQHLPNFDQTYAGRWATHLSKIGALGLSFTAGSSALIGFGVASRLGVTAMIPLLLIGAGAALLGVGTAKLFAYTASRRLANAAKTHLLHKFNLFSTLTNPLHAETGDHLAHHGDAMSVTSSTSTDADSGSEEVRESIHVANRN